MDTLYLWRWYLPDLKGKLKPSRWRMTEADAQVRHPGCTKVEGSLEVRQFEPDTGTRWRAGWSGATMGRWCSRPRCGSGATALWYPDWYPHRKQAYKCQCLLPIYAPHPLVPTIRIERMTYRLQGGCSTS
jgi:hypothetical protein